MPPNKFELKETFLPPDAPDYIIASASRNRWVVPIERQGGKTKKYILPDTLSAAQQTASAQNIIPQTWVLVSDASRPDTLENVHNEALAHLDFPDRPARTFLSTRKTRRSLIEDIMKDIHAPPDSYDVVKAEIDGSGYGDNRETLDNTVAALSKAAGRHVNFLTVDDDVSLIRNPLHWKQEALLSYGINERANSQVVFAFQNGQSKKDLLEIKGTNDLISFFAPLGQTVTQLRRNHPQMKVSEMAVDTRPEAFERALSTNQPAQFIVSADGGEIDGADSGIIIATTEDKSGLPDYPTLIISKGILEAEYPDEEPVEAYPSGPKVLYAALRSDTIFPDSALFARRFDGSNVRDPAYWPWWHVSSLKASKEAGIGESSFRSDNDFLPKWLAYIHHKTGTLYLYASGIPTYAQHTRTPFGGDRRNAHEAAIASQVGNIAAVETFKRFEFPANGTIYMRPIEEKYDAPDEHAQIVFDRMHLIAEICERKIIELSTRRNNSTNQALMESLDQKIAKYNHELDALKRKMSNFVFADWKPRLDQVIRNQLVFSQQALAYKPRIIEALSRRIKQGKYPVLEIVRT